MRTRIWAGVLGACMVASVLGMQSASAAKPTPIPKKVQVEDPLGDANFLNDQDTTGTPASGQGDNVGPENTDGGSVSDLLKVWFTNDKKNVSVHILTEAAPPASTTGSPGLP
jgi:hypothetical protein